MSKKNFAVRECRNGKFFAADAFGEWDFVADEWGAERYTELEATILKGNLLANGHKGVQVVEFHITFVSVF